MNYDKLQDEINQRVESFYNKNDAYTTDCENEEEFYLELYEYLVGHEND